VLRSCLCFIKLRATNWFYFHIRMQISADRQDLFCCQLGTNADIYPSLQQNILTQQTANVQKINWILVFKMYYKSLKWFHLDFPLKLKDLKTFEALYKRPITYVHSYIHTYIYTYYTHTYIHIYVHTNKHTYIRGLEL